MPPVSESSALPPSTDDHQVSAPRSAAGGIFYGWWILAVCTLVSVAADVAYNPVLSVFVKPVTEDLGWNRATFAGAITGGALLGGLACLLLGRVLDRRGARDIMIGGGALLGACMLLLSRLDAVWQFYILIGLARACAIAASQMAATVAISNWFIKKRGRAIGMMYMGGRLGGGVIPLFAQPLIQGVGWRSTWAILGLFVWVTSILPPWLAIRRRPEDMGLRPDGEMPEAGQPVPVGSLPLKGRSRQSDAPWTLPLAMHTPSFWILTVVAGQAMMATGGVNLHQVAYMTDRGISPGEAVAALAVFSFCGGVSGLAWGFLAERVTIRLVLFSSMLLSGLGVLSLLFVYDTATVFGYAVFYGLAMGGNNALAQVAFADYYGRRSLGAIAGFTTPFMVATNALGPLAAGLLFDMRGDYIVSFALLAAMNFTGGLLMLFAPPPQFPAPATVVTRSPL